MTATEVLRTICDRQGADVLSDGERLLSFFDDYSRGKLRPQADALRALVECGGNKRFAQLRTAPPLRQKAELHWLVQKLAAEYSMHETMAREICGAVWEAFCGTKAPLSQISESVVKPAPEEAKEKPKTVGQPTPREAEPKAIDPAIPPENPMPILSKPKREFARQLKQKSRFVLCMLAAGISGAIGSIVIGIMGVWLLITSEGVRTGDIPFVLFFLWLGIVTVRRGVKIWQEKTGGKTISRWQEKWSRLAMLFHGIGVVLFIILIVDTKGAGMTWGSWLLFFSWLLNAAFNIYWHVCFIYDNDVQPRKKGRKGA